MNETASIILYCRFEILRREDYSSNAILSHLKEEGESLISKITSERGKKVVEQRLIQTMNMFFSPKE